jgi:hypothetical protein
VDWYLKHKCRIKRPLEVSFTISKPKVIFEICSSHRTAYHKVMCSESISASLSLVLLSFRVCCSWKVSASRPYPGERILFSSDFLCATCSEHLCLYPKVFCHFNDNLTGFFWEANCIALKIWIVFSASSNTHDLHLPGFNNAWRSVHSFLARSLLS